LHGGVGDVAAGLVTARESGGAVVRGRWTTQRVQHAHLETHGCTGWRDDEGRLVIRTSSQVPFLVRDELCHVFGLDRSEVHVFTRRVGGGFGGKQEMLTEDLVALAVLRLSQPVRYEFSRTDEFTTAPCRHPFRVDATVAAGADGVLTALAVDVLVDAGAYGNHSPGVMFHGCGESVSVYRCANKRVDAQSVYTNNIPSGAFRGYGLGRPDDIIQRHPKRCRIIHHYPETERTRFFFAEHIDRSFFLRRDGRTAEKQHEPRNIEFSQ